MTASGKSDVMYVGPSRLTAGLSRFERLDLAAHQAVFGTMPLLDFDHLVGMVERVNLCGRGGAAFPFGRKLRAVADASHRRKRRPVVLVNASEGEPGSAKDTMLTLRSPLLVLGGALAAARALRTTEIVVGVTRSDVARSISAAASEDPDLRQLVRVIQLPDRFISGEGGALVSGINGKAALPPGRKILPSDTGVRGRPTLLSNAETFAQLAVLAMLGPEGFASVGTATEPGTVLLTVGGSADRPVVLEVPTGLPLGMVLDMFAAAHADGILVGGYHGMWLSTETAYSVPVSRAGLAAVGGTLGAGIVLPLEATCPLGEVARVASYLAVESSGQCGPCKLGLPGIARSLAELASGSGGIEALDAARRGAAAVKGRGACAHPDGAFRFVMSALDVFTDDLTAHMFRGTCGRPVRRVLPLPTEQSQTRLRVDWTRCRGHGLCAQLLPELVRLDGQGYPVFLDMPVPPWLQSQAQQAVRMCPSLALTMAPPPSSKSAKPARRSAGEPEAVMPTPGTPAVRDSDASLKMIARSPTEFELDVSDQWIAELSEPSVSPVSRTAVPTESLRQSSGPADLS
jgi:NADH:ubiquinone oxidoreductase subunit F (NADH-binding)/ferredoxin